MFTILKPLLVDFPLEIRIKLIKARIKRLEAPSQNICNKLLISLLQQQLMLLEQMKPLRIS